MAEPQSRIPGVDGGSTGRAEYARAQRANLSLFGAVFVFSIFVNLLMLTGPIFMLQVYDRVLGSRSEETLLTLVILMGFLFAMMGILDYARGRVLARSGARLQAGLDRRVFDALIRASLRKGGTAGATGLQDLEAVQRLFTSPVLLAIYDLPWTPIFLVGIFIFHPWLGWLAVGGGTFLVLVALLNQRLTTQGLHQATGTGRRADLLAGQILTEGETVNAMGMRNAAFRRWQALRMDALGATLDNADRSGGFTALTKVSRMFLQSAMLGLGAYLVLLEALTPGAMIAASILLGRALAPIEMTIGQWPLVQRAMQGRRDLIALLTEVQSEAPRTELPRPKALLEVTDLTVLPPGESRPALRGIRFTLLPGQALGVIGVSGAGKSTLARALTGLWPSATGAIRLDGATLDQYDPDALGRYVGYLPQQVRLFEGTIKANIARLDDSASDADVVRAAQRADAHDMILHLPEGYETQVTAANQRLSGGQVQRLGLARALFGDPVLLVLDEPNSNLDSAGSVALNAAIKAMKDAGNAVLIMAHRPAAIQHCDTLLVLDSGQARAFGPRDEVLKATVANHEGLRRAGVGVVT